MTDELSQAKLKGNVKDAGTPLDLFLQDETFPYDEDDMMAFTTDAILEGKVLDKLEAYKPATNTIINEQEAQYQEHLKNLKEYFDDQEFIQENLTQEEINIIFYSLKEIRKKK